MSIAIKGPKIKAIGNTMPVKSPEEELSAQVILFNARPNRPLFLLVPLFTILNQSTSQARFFSSVLSVKDQDQTPGLAWDSSVLDFNH